MTMTSDFTLASEPRIWRLRITERLQALRNWVTSETERHRPHPSPPRAGRVTERVRSASARHQAPASSPSPGFSFWAAYGADARSALGCWVYRSQGHARRPPGEQPARPPQSGSVDWLVTRHLPQFLPADLQSRGGGRPGCVSPSASFSCNAAEACPPEENPSLPRIDFN